MVSLRSMVGDESGSVFWRLLIVILSVAVVLSVLIPQLNQMKEEQETALCREQMSQLAEVQDNYIEIRGVYADNPDSLKAFLAQEVAVTCPTNGRPYLMSAVDSTSYTISCPNEHGMINTGKMSWEKK